MGKFVSSGIYVQLRQNKPTHNRTSMRAWLTRLMPFVASCPGRNKTLGRRIRANVEWRQRVGATVRPFLAFIPDIPLVFFLLSPNQTKKVHPDLLSVPTVCFLFGTSTLHSFSCGIVPAIHSLGLHSLCRDPDFQYLVYQPVGIFNTWILSLPCDPPLQSNWPPSSLYVIKLHQRNPSRHS